MQSVLTVVSGDVQDSRVVRVITFIDELREKKSTASSIYKRTLGDPKWSVFHLEWTAIDLCLIKQPSPTLAIIAEIGRLMLINASGPKIIEVAPGTDGPAGYGPLRQVCAIGEAAYAVGMGRQVYRILPDGTWSVFEDGISRPTEATDVCGFNAIHGIGNDQLCAVGFNGEIWLNKSGKWTQQDSPTNGVLHCVRMNSEGMIFAGGQGGILLQGLGNHFSPILFDADSDIWSVEIFKGRVFFCTESNVFVWDSGDVQVVDMGGHWGTFRTMRCCDDVMFVFGPKTILRTYDGVLWEPINL